MEQFIPFFVLAFFSYCYNSINRSASKTIILRHYLPETKMMTSRFSYLFLILLIGAVLSAQGHAVLKLFHANNPNIQYFGRVDFSNPLKPRFWSPGVYIRIKFKGPACDLILNDEMGGDN